MLFVMMNSKTVDFVSFERLFEEISFTSGEEEVLVKYTCDYDFTTVEQQGPGWIFSLLNVVRAELAGDEIVLEEYRTLNAVFIRILEWLIEGSAYLKCFDGVKLNDARMQIERYLDEAIAARRGIRLIASGEEGSYMIDKLQKLTVSGYLYKKSLVWITLLTAARFSPRMQQVPAHGLVLLVYHTQNKSHPGIMDQFNQRVAALREQDDVYCYEGYTDEQIADTVWLLGARLLLGESVQEELATTRGMFFRYLYVLLDRKEECMRKNAFNSLLYNQKTPLFTWDDLLTFSVSHLTETIVSKSTEVVRNCQGRRFEGQGHVLVETKTITLSSAGLTNFLTPLEIDGIALRVGTNRKKLDFDESLTTTAKSWRSVFADFSDELKKNVIGKKRPPVGTVLKIRVKFVYELKPVLAFVYIVDDLYEGQGALHVSQVTRAKLDTLEGILQPGDTMMATVAEDTNDRLQFSLWDELNPSVAEHVQPGDFCVATLLNERNGLMTWLSKQGFVVFTRADEMFPAEEGCTYTLEITDIPPTGKIKGKIVHVSEEKVDRHQAVANLVRWHVDRSTTQKPGGDTEKFNTGKIERSVPVSEKYVKELIRLLQLFLTREVNLRNLNLLYYIRLLAHVLGDERLKGYYDCLINHLIVKYEFIEGSLGKVDLKSLGKDFRAFPALIPQWDVVQMLGSYGDDSRANVMVLCSRSDNEYVANVARTILSGKLRKDIPGEADPLQEDLLTLLSVKDRGADDTVGVEEARRFKASLVYPDGSRSADVEAQIDIMMHDVCNFLNHKGGEIYIGVDDEGNAVGVQADLDYLCCSLDKYEVFLHRRIAEAFGEEVDRSITVERREEEEVTIFVLTVPPAPHVVEYHPVN